MKKARQHRRGPVECVAGRHCPPSGPGQTVGPTGIDVELTPYCAGIGHCRESGGHGRTGFLGDVVGQDRQVLDDVAIGIDDRMIELSADRTGVHGSPGDVVCRHLVSGRSAMSVRLTQTVEDPFDHATRSTGHAAIVLAQLT